MGMHHGILRDELSCRLMIGKLRQIMDVLFKEFSGLGFIGRERVMTQAWSSCQQNRILQSTLHMVHFFW